MRRVGHRTQRVFIRHAGAHDTAALMGCRTLDVALAAHHVIHDKVAPAGGRGGVIAPDRHGGVAMPHSTEGLFWALARAHRPVKTNACHLVVGSSRAAAVVR